MTRASLARICAVLLTGTMAGPAGAQDWACDNLPAIDTQAPWLEVAPVQRRITQHRLQRSQAALDLRRALDNYRVARQAIARLEEELRQARAELAALIRARDQTLWELRQGYFCSQCGRSRTEIREQTGQGFEEHLQSVQGERVPAPPEVIARAEQRYNARIVPLESRVVRLQAELNAQIRRRDDASAGIWPAYSAWRVAVTGLHQGVTERRRRDRWRTRHRLEALRASTFHIYCMVAAGQLPPENGRGAHQHFVDMQQRERARIRGLQNDHQAWLDQARTEARRFVADASEAGLSLVSPYWSWVPTLDLSIAGLRLSVSPESMRVGASFGRFFSGSVTVENDPALLRQRTRACLEGSIVGSSVSGCMNRETTWGPNGVTTREYPSDSVDGEETRYDEEVVPEVEPAPLPAGPASGVLP